jgi:adenylate cyclase
VWRADDAQRAVACAVAMQRGMKAVNDKNVAEGLPVIEMGVGLHTGEVVVGNIGSDKRAKYGVVGSAVNLTSRIESYTVGGQVLASENTVADAEGIAVIGDQMTVEPKGVKAPITISEIIGVEEPYNIHLDRVIEVFQPVTGPLTVEYVVVEGKDTGGAGETGTLVALSEKSGQLRTQRVVPPTSVLKLRLAGESAGVSDEVFYGKVATRHVENGTGFFVRFTSVPTVIKAYLDGRLAPS